LTTFFFDANAEAVEIVYGGDADMPSANTSSGNGFGQDDDYQLLFRSINIQKESQLIAEGNHPSERRKGFQPSLIQYE
jgi:hypothetical protein